MKNAKPIGTLLANQFKLRKMKSLTSEKEKRDMATIPYSFIVKSLIMSWFVLI